MVRVSCVSAERAGDGEAAHGERADGAAQRGPATRRARAAAAHAPAPRALPHRLRARRRRSLPRPTHQLHHLHSHITTVLNMTHGNVVKCYFNCNKKYGLAIKVVN